MIREDLSELVSKSQMGDEQALIQLLLQAYSPISYLSRKILQNERTASQVTLEVLEILSQKLHSLDDTTQFESWVCRITAARCVQAMPLLHRAAAKSVSASRWDNTLEDSQILTEAQSAEVIQEMVDSLPEDQRLCILLISCCGLNIMEIIDQLENRLGIPVINSNQCTLWTIGKYFGAHGPEAYRLGSLFTR